MSTWLSVQGCPGLRREGGMLPSTTCAEPAYSGPCVCSPSSGGSHLPGSPGPTYEMGQPVPPRVPGAILLKGQGRWPTPQERGSLIRVLADGDLWGAVPALPRALLSLRPPRLRCTPPSDQKRVIRSRCPRGGSQVSRPPALGTSAPCSHGPWEPERWVVC